MADIQFFPVTAGGTFTATVKDNNGNPATILEAARNFSVEGNITINAGNVITGTATVTVYADQLGGPIDRDIGTTGSTININGDGTFPWTVTVAGGTLPDAPAGQSNLYRLAAVLTMVNSLNVLTETSSFVDLDTFRIS